MGYPRYSGSAATIAALMLFLCLVLAISAPVGVGLLKKFEAQAAQAGAAAEQERTEQARIELDREKTDNQQELDLMIQRQVILDHNLAVVFATLGDNTYLALGIATSIGVITLVAGMAASAYIVAYFKYKR